MDLVRLTQAVIAPVSKLAIIGLVAYGDTTTRFLRLVADMVENSFMAWSLVALLGLWVVSDLYRAFTQNKIVWKPWPRVLWRGSFHRFDVSIRQAIYHLIETTPHSYTQSSLAEREALNNLYKAMCDGRLPVIGKEGDFMMPRRISRWECRRLKPMEVVVNATEAAPDGVRFSLILDKTEDGHKVELELCDLRVRSRDLYAVWPKV